MSLGGDELQLRHGDLTAVVTEVGGGLRLLRHRDRDLVLPYRRDEVRPRYRGALLAPWVNRVVDGRYTFDGTTHQLGLNEPERHHALHGLVCWVRWKVLDAEENAATLVHRLVPQPGYPFEVELRATYRLGADGLTCTVTGRNVGAHRAPYGAAGHPYVMAASGALDTWTLTLPATHYLKVTADRLVPAGTAGVQGGDYDFVKGRRLEGLAVDHAFTGLEPAGDGLAHALVTDQAGHGVECVWDPGVLPWVQVHTADLPIAEQSRLALALEPMPSPPNAFGSGTDLVVLDPGDHHVASWRIAPV